jgi:hypothetical protein
VGHAVVAVRNGIEVEGIMLWLLGGVARLRSEALGGCADGRALVTYGGQLVGIISPSDISRAAALRGIGIQSFDGADLARPSGSLAMTRSPVSGRSKAMTALGALTGPANPRSPKSADGCVRNGTAALERC